jgi:hypothetical protein
LSQSRSRYQENDNKQVKEAVHFGIKEAIQRRS